MKKITRHYAKAKIDDAKLQKLWPSRLSDADLAKKMGHHRNTVRRRAAKLGLALRREIWARTP